MEVKATQFWNVNVDDSNQTDECPGFLLYCFENDKDRSIIATPDKDYQRMSWSDVKKAVETERLDIFTRIPSELRRYREYCEYVKETYGSILTYIVRERLGWHSIDTTSDNFQNPDDYKILYNDWPYGIDKSVIHLIVWTKFSMPEDPSTDRLYPDMQDKIEKFIRNIFRRCCEPSNMVWFRNWVSLKSVHSVEHFHVMLHNPNMDAIADITNETEPLAVKMGYINR